MEIFLPENMAILVFSHLDVSSCNQPLISALLSSERPLVHLSTENPSHENLQRPEDHTEVRLTAYVLGKLDALTGSKWGLPATLSEPQPRHLLSEEEGGREGLCGSH